MREQVDAERAVEIARVRVGLLGLDHDPPQGQVLAAGPEVGFVQHADRPLPGGADAADRRFITTLVVTHDQAEAMTQDILTASVPLMPNESPNMINAIEIK